MNKIRNLEALEAIRSRLPDGPRRKPKNPSKNGPQEAPDAPQERLSDAEAEAYGDAFDALLTLWQAVATMPPFRLPPAVAQAQTAATIRLRPLLEGAMKAVG